jgi:hypothetical protein
MSNASKRALCINGDLLCPTGCPKIQRVSDFPFNFNWLKKNLFFYDIKIYKIIGKEC